jgi:hypothetical protein
MGLILKGVIMANDLDLPTDPCLKSRVINCTCSEWAAAFTGTFIQPRYNDYIIIFTNGSKFTYIPYKL